MISKYNSFIIDMLLEKAINESFLYYSPNVRKALSRIKGNDIATELLGSEGTDVKPDMTFIDLGKEGYFSFLDGGYEPSKVMMKMNKDDLYNYQIK